MKVLLATLCILASAGAYANEIKCSVEGNAIGTAGTLLQGVAKIADAKSPRNTFDVGYESQNFSRSMTINGIEGTLHLTVDSKFFASEGDAHPLVDVGAFFYPKTDPSRYSLIAVRAEASPTLNQYGPRKPSHRIWVAGLGATVECGVDL